MGREKYAEIIEGKHLIERVVDRLCPLFSELLIVVSQRNAKVSFNIPGAKTLIDIFSKKGSLVGIYTGLIYSSHSRNIIVGCDMPFLNTELLRYMVTISHNYDIVIPRMNNLIEPLHAVYSRNCIEPIREQLTVDNLKINGFYDKVRVRYLEEDEIDSFDPDHLSFFNINTQADLDRAQQIVAAAKVTH